MIDLALLPDFSRRHGLLVRHAQRDRVPFAVLEGRLPTRERSRTIVRHGYGLHLLKSATESEGSAVVAMQPNLKHLMVTGVDLELQWIERLTKLESLSINGTIASPADLSKLDALDEYGGTTPGAETAFDCPAIKHISIDDVREGKLPSIPNQLVRLSLTDLQRTRRLTPRLGESQLEHISFIGSRKFDANSLRPFQRLRSIELTQVVAMSTSRHSPHSRNSARCHWRTAETSTDDDYSNSTPYKYTSGVGEASLSRCRTSRANTATGTFSRRSLHRTPRDRRRASLEVFASAKVRA